MMILLPTLIKVSFFFEKFKFWFAGRVEEKNVNCINIEVIYQLENI